MIVTEEGDAPHVTTLERLNVKKGRKKEAKGDGTKARNEVKKSGRKEGRVAE